MLKALPLSDQTGESRQQLVIARRNPPEAPRPGGSIRIFFFFMPLPSIQLYLLFNINRNSWLCWFVDPELLILRTAVGASSALHQNSRSPRGVKGTWIQWVVSVVSMYAHMYLQSYIYIYIYILHIRFLAGFSPQTPLQAWLKSGNRIQIPFTWGGPPPRFHSNQSFSGWAATMAEPPTFTKALLAYQISMAKRAYHLHNHPTQKGGPPWSSTHAHCQEGSSSSLCLHLEAARSP